MAADHFEPAPPRNGRPWSVFVPLLFLAVSYLAWTVFQTMQFVAERKALATMRTNQEKPLEESKKARERLDTLSRDTRLLAERGNPGAARIVEELRKRGIMLTPTHTPSQAEPAAPGTPPPLEGSGK
jgi:hypothetical protein